MSINRNNYEEYFLLYIDHELNADDRNAVEVFIKDNPDLREELGMLQQLVVRADKRVLFNDKASLLKSSTAANPVNETNYEEYFLLYADNELSNEEKDLVEQFVYKNPQHQAVFELYDKIHFTPDTSIVFANKQVLYRSEKDERVIVMRWWKIAVAAVVLLFMGVAGWYFSGNQTKKTIDTVVKGTDTNSTKLLNPVIVEKNNYVQVNPSDKSAPEKLVIPAKKNSVETKKTNHLIEKEQPILVKNIIEEKKLPVQRNIIETPPVTLIETGKDVAGNETKEKDIKKEIVPIVNTAVIDGPVGIKDVSETNTQPIVSYAINTNDRIEVLTTSVSNKTKLRGFFRKVSRVVDKATSFGNGEKNENKNGIRIANFEIALK